MLSELSGQIERITFTNEDSGFTIAKIKVRGAPNPVTIVGNLIAPMPGEMLKMTGEWQQHPKYGEQFKVKDYQTIVPATVDGIWKYLGSGMVRGIGPVMAERIVRKFGDKTLSIIDEDIARLAEVDGIGSKRIKMIERAWDDQKEIRNVMVFLQAYGVSAGYAQKIYKTYGNRSIAMVKSDPYRLASDIFGIGFLTADQIAEKLGFPHDAKVRIEAGVLYILRQAAEEGHVYYPDDLLVKKAGEVLSVKPDIISGALKALAGDNKIVITGVLQDPANSVPGYKAVYLEKYYACETRIANQILQLVYMSKRVGVYDPQRALLWLQKQTAISLAAKQVEAITCALQEKMMVITGGPGTGKTTIIHGIIKINMRIGAGILLAAPTGRAAKRLSEATGHDASTIHRLLKYNAAKGGFLKNEDNPLDCDLLIVDEASMIDTVLMHHLLKAMPRHATFILVGDIHQLPSVGAGNTLKDIIASGIIPVVELNEIFRQAQKSQIIVNAHRINTGTMPLLETPDTDPQDNDFYFIEQEDPEKVLQTIVELVSNRIPGRFGFDSIDAIQVLTPMHKGPVGVENLNRALQERLNPQGETLARGNRTFRVDDKVMQVKNNYEKDVYNGDIGRIARIDPIDQELVVVYDGNEATYGFTDLDEIVLAYAISIHKSQGSEFPAVVMPVLTQHYILLQRNLIYTAITRGRQLVVMVGTRKALAIGVNNNETQARFTYLAQRLKDRKRGIT